jgi:hypothetical protein
MKVYMMHAGGMKEVEMEFKSAEGALDRLGVLGRGVETIKDDTGTVFRVDLGRGFSTKKGEVIRKTSLAASLYRQAG